MKKALKLDLYKIFHSKVTIISIIFCMIFALARPIVLYVVQKSFMVSVYEQAGTDAIISLMTFIFSVILSNQDVASGFMNNIYSRQGKTAYVLSKIVCITVFIAIMYVYLFIVYSFFDLTFGFGEIFSQRYYHWGEFNGWNILLGFLLGIFVHTVFGMEVFSLSTITKKPLIISIIFLAYVLYFISYLDYLQPLLGFNLRQYIISGIAWDFMLASILFPRTFLRIIIASCIYFILFLWLSFLSFRNKRSKKDVCEDCVLEAREISKSFKKKQVLHDVNIKIRKGEIYGLVGNNGAGKTTLLKIMFGILAPNEGKIYAAKEGLSTGALISKPNLYKDMSAFENLKAMAIAIGYKCEDKELYDLLELVGLSETGKKMAGRFSTGMKQRLGIALAIVGNPDVLILDEPISGLDIEGIVDTRKILLKLNKERGTTIIISSHILDELSKITTRICLMKKGKIIYEDTMENFMKKGNGKSAEESYIEILSENVSA